MLTPPLFTSAVPDPPGEGLLNPTRWNRVTGLLSSLLDTDGPTGGLLMRDAGAVNGAAWLEPAAAGAVLVSAGDAAPEWSRDPIVDSLAASLLNVGTIAAQPTDSVFNIGNGDDPPNIVGTIIGRTAMLGWKNAALSILYGGIIGGGASSAGTGAIADGFRVLGNSGPLILQENGGSIVLGAPIHFGGVAATNPGIRRSGLELLFKTATNSAFTSARLADVFLNQNGNANGQILVGGIDADRSFGGIWVGQAAPSFSNYSFLANAGGNSTTLFNVPNVNGLVEFRVINGGRFTVGNSGVAINEAGGTSPARPLRVKAQDRTTIVFDVDDNGQARAPLLGAFAAGDKYVTIDANGNLHRSAIGPAS